MTIVVDASVAVKWFVPEPGNDAAQKLLAGDKPLIAPALIRIEVTSAFVRQFRRDVLPEEDARAAHEAWEQMLTEGTIRLVADADLFEEAVACAFAARHDLPDCLYLALAKRMRALVVTADAALVERGRRVYDKISLLEGSNAN